MKERKKKEGKNKQEEKKNDSSVTNERTDEHGLSFIGKKSNYVIRLFET